MSVKIDYVEIPCRDLLACKAFFSTVFGWSFSDDGPAYSAFSGAGIDGGFFQSERCSRQNAGAVLQVLFERDLDGARQRIIAAGGQVCRPVFAFPGGRRFHFQDPAGNEYAVWSDAGPEQDA